MHGTKNFCRPRLVTRIVRVEAGFIDNVYTVGLWVKGISRDPRTHRQRKSHR